MLVDATLTTMIERRVVPPWGAFGGAPGAPYRVTLTRDGVARDVKGKETVRLRAADVVTIETCGGGGYGDPAARSPEGRRRDRLEGYALEEPAGSTGPGRA
jgi:N-methylhydantoinase B/oxoprolinase/acetone carboxylase alpha subunit